MLKPDQRELRAFMALHGSPDGAILEDYLRRLLAHLALSLEVQLDEPKLRVLQGQAQAVRQLLSLLSDARAALDRSTHGPR